MNLNQSEYNEYEYESERSKTRLLHSDSGSKLQLVIAMRNSRIHVAHNMPANQTALLVKSGCRFNAVPVSVGMPNS